MKLLALSGSLRRASINSTLLRETLKTMAAVIVESASITIPLLGAGLDEAAILASSSVAGSIRAVLDALQQALRSRQIPAAVEFSLG